MSGAKPQVCCRYIAQGGWGALANKLARMAWAMMARGERYRNPVALAA